MNAGVAIGAFVGGTAWCVALAIAFVAVGRKDLLVPVVLPLLLASSSLVSLLLVAIRSLDLQGGERVVLILGAVAAIVGVLLLLVEAWVSPVLESDAGLQRFIASTGGVTRVPRWVATALLGVGAALLLRAVLR